MDLFRLHDLNYITFIGIAILCMVNNTALANLNHTRFTNSSLSLYSRNINDTFSQSTDEQKCKLENRNEALAVC